MRLLPFQHDPPRLPLLEQIHPGADRAGRVELGLRTVPVAAIRGTTSATQTLRDRAFMPSPVVRGRNWTSRWQRLLQAERSLAVLPPVDLIQVGDEYWVVDGHNRLALAHAAGQLEVDANVTALTGPSVPPTPTEPGLLKPLLADGVPLRAAMRRPVGATSSRRTDAPTMAPATPSWKGMS